MPRKRKDANEPIRYNGGNIRPTVIRKSIALVHRPLAGPSAAYETLRGSGYPGHFS